MFDVGITGVYRPRGGAKRIVHTMASRKNKHFNQIKEIINGTHHYAKIQTDTWHFFPLCMDSAGGWARATMAVIDQCAKRIPEDIRGNMVTLWRQQISIAIQRENHRILKDKIEHILEATIADDDIGPLSEEELCLIPGLNNHELGYPTQTYYAPKHIPTTLPKKINDEEEHAVRVGGGNSIRLGNRDFKKIDQHWKNVARTEEQKQNKPKTKKEQDLKKIYQYRVGGG